MKEVPAHYIRAGTSINISRRRVNPAASSIGRLSHLPIAVIVNAVVVDFRRAGVDRRVGNITIYSINKPISIGITISGYGFWL